MMKLVIVRLAPGTACSARPRPAASTPPPAAPEDELGAAFDLRAFHDTVLGAGALPLDLLERRIDEWIARRTRAPSPAH